MYVIAFAVPCSGVSVFVVGYACYFAEKQCGEIYALSNGKSLILALSQDEKISHPVEAKERVRRLHELFFNLAPDKKAVEDNTECAFFMADKSTFSYYKDLAEEGYYNRIISGNIPQRIVVDSVRYNFNNYPYQVETFAKQFITRVSNITERSLITSCRLINSMCSDSSPQGFIIEQFNITENKDLRIVER